MGQPITVYEKPTTEKGVVRFEINRSLTGMGHEVYRSLDDCTSERPPSVLARRLFEHGGVEQVHVYSNIVTVRLQPGAGHDGMLDVIKNLYIHYLPGVVPSYPEA